MSEIATPAKSVTKHRSPNYPVIGLRKAVERAEILFSKDKRAWLPIGIVHERWDYKAHTGVGNQNVAALKAYGLIDVEGDGDSRKIRVSERAYKIILNHQDRDGPLRAAALDPTLHGELWKQWGDSGLPADDVMRHYLLFDRKFNPETVDGFISQFRDTIAFAKLDSSDKVSSNDGEKEPEHADTGGEGVTMNRQPNTPDLKDQSITPSAGSRKNTFAFDEGDATLIYPANLSEDSLEDFKDWLQLAIRKIERSIKRKTDAPDPN